MKKNWKRILAAMLAASMIFGNAVPAYATESQPVVEVVEAENEVAEDDTVLEETDVVDDTNASEETVLENVEETTDEATEIVTENTAEPEAELANVEEGEPEEILIQEVVTEVSTVNTYNSSEYLHAVNTEYWNVYNRTDDGSHFLIVELKDPENVDMDWLIAGIDECKAYVANEVEERGAGYTSLRIEVQYDNFTGSKVVPVSLWNALAAYAETAASQYFSTWFFFSNPSDIQYKWVFEDIQKITDGSTSVNMDISVNIDSDSTIVTMPDTSFSCSGARILFCVYSTRTKTVYENFVQQYGTENIEVEIWKEGSAEPLDNTASYFYGSDNAEVNLGWVSNYTEGNYILKKQESVEEGYTGTINDGGKGLVIDHYKLSDAANFQSAAEEILKTRAEDTTTKFRRIEINYPVITGSISASLWNAAVALLDPLEEDEDTELHVNFYDDERTNHNWRFVNPYKVTSTNAIDTGIELEFYKDEIDGLEQVTEITVRFDKTNYAAEKAYIGFYTNNDRYYSTIDGVWNDFADFTQYFGNSTSEVLLINESTQTSTDGWYEVDNSGEPRGFWLDGFDAKKLTAGVKYLAEKKKYAGSVQREDGQKVLYIRHWETDTFDNDVILDALQARIDAGEDFAQVTICYPYDYSTTIPKDIWNAVAALMNNDEWSAGFLFDGGDYMDKNWFVAGMREAEADVVLNAALTDIGTGTALAKVTFTDTNKVPANDVHIRFCTSHWNDGTVEGTGAKLDYADVVNTFGTDNIQLELYDVSEALVKDVSARYEYYSNGPGNDNLDVCFDNVNNYSNGTYTVVRKPYRGDTGSWDDGTSWLNINAYDFEHHGETFSDAAVIKILTDRKANDESFDRVEIQVPESYTSISVEVWNAAVALLNEEFHDRGIQINFDSEEAGTGFWFNRPETTDKAVSLVGGLEFNKELAPGEYRDMLEFADTDYPAEHVHWGYWADSNNENMQSTVEMLFEKFGDESANVGLYGAEGESPEEVGGHFSVERREDGSVNLNLGFSNIKNLPSQTMYGVATIVYTGDVSEQDGEQIRLTIDPWNAGRDGAIFTTRQIDERLGNRGEKFNQIEFVIPWSESNTIYADWIEIAKDFLTPNQSGNTFVIFTFVDYEEEFAYEVWMRNPGVPQSDVTFKCDMSVDETNGTVKAVVKEMELNADLVFIQYHGASWRDGSFAQRLKEKFGDAWENYYQMSDAKYPKAEAVYSIYNGWGDYDRHFEILDYNKFNDNDKIKEENINFAFKLNEYSGHIRGEGTLEKELFIDMNDFAVYGLEATDAAVIDVINKHADDQINWVVIDNYTSRFISKEVWNAAVGILEKETEHVIRIHVRDNEEGMDWWFSNPTEALQALPLTATFTFGEENQVTFDHTDYPADYVACNYWTNNGDEDDTRVDEKHNAMKEAFGTSYTRVAVLDAEDVAGEYNVYTGDNGYLDLNVNIWNIKNMTANTAYTLEVKEYTGDLYETEYDGVELTTLCIDPWSAGKPDGFSLEDIKAILEARKDDTFNHLEFIIPVSEENVIQADFVNEALKLADTNFAKATNGHRYLLFNFTDRENGITYVVWIVNPGEFTDDVKVQFDLGIDESRRIIFADVNKMDINGEEVFIQYCESPDQGIAQNIVNCFGEMEDGFEFINPTAEHITATYTYIRGQYFDRVLFEVNAGSTGFDQDYTEDNALAFELKPYIGNTFTDDEGYYRLELKEYEANEAGFEFNDETIVRALELRANEEDRFDIVHIGYDHGECINHVSEHVWNAAVNLLDEESEAKRLEIHSADDKGNGENWFFFNPYGTGAGIGLDNEVIIGGPNELAKVRFENNSYPADHAQLSIWADYATEGSNYDALVAAFGTKNGSYDLVDEDGYILDYEGGEYYHEAFENEDGEKEIRGFGFNIGNVNHLWADYTYTMCQYAGNEENGMLFIDSWEAGKNGEAFTLEEIERILDTRENMEYEAIFVTQEEDTNNTVYALIASKLAQRLVDWAEKTLLRFDFRYADGSGADILYLVNPDKQSPLNGEDLVLDTELTWDDENNEAVVDITAMPNVNAEAIVVAFNPYYGNGLEKKDADKIRSAFGGMPYENYKLKLDGETDNDNSETVEAYYQKQDEGIYLEVGYTKDFDKDKTYRISRAEYIGEVMDFLDGTEALLINAWHAGKDDEPLTSEEVAAIVAERVDAGDKFASVELLQPHTATNKISAADAVELMKLLQAPGEDNELDETYLSFTFVDLGRSTSTVRLVNPEENAISEDTIFDAYVECEYIDETWKPIVYVNSTLQFDAQDVIVGITEENGSGLGWEIQKYFGGAGGFTYELGTVVNGNIEPAIRSFYTQYDEAACIEVSDPNGFNRSYEFVPAEYNGTVEDLGNGREKLYINAWQARKFDVSQYEWENEIDRILDYRYDEGKTFANVEIVCPYDEESNTISSSIAEKASGLLDRSDDHCLKFTYCYTDGSGDIVSLILENPERAPLKTARGNFQAELSFNTKGQLVVTVDPIAFRAEKQVVYFDLSYEGYFADELSWVFGGVTDRAYDMKTSDANATGTYIPMEHGVYLEVAEPDGFNLGGTYALTKKPYLGNVDYDENGRRGLALYHWEMNDEGVDLTNATQVVNIFNQWKADGETFDIVEIFYESYPGTISYKVWNAMRALLNSVTDGEIRIVFCNPLMVDGEVVNGRDEKWIFRGTKSASKNFALNSNWDFENDTISFGNVTFPAEEAYVGFWADSMAYEPDDDYDNQRYQTVDVIKNALNLDKDTTDRYYALHLNDTLTESGFYSNYGEDEFSRWIYSGDIPVTGLKANTVYDIKTPEKYAGDTFTDEEGNQVLVISQFALDYYGMSTDVEGFDTVINEVLNAKEAETFHVINVIYKANPGTISSTTWNALVNKLSDGDDTQLIINGPDSDFHVNWFFKNPVKAEESTTVDVSAGIAMNESELQVNYAEDKFPASEVEVVYYVNNEVETFETLSNSFAMSDTDFRNLTVINSTGKFMSSEIGAHVGKYEYGDYQEFEFYIADAKSLEGDTHTLKPYLGHIDEWTDEGGTKRTALNIHYGMAGLDRQFTEEELQKILAYHAEKVAKYDEVRIEQKYEEDNNLVYPSVADAAAALLKEDGNQILTLSFWYDDVFYVNWNLTKPGDQPIGDSIKTLHADVTADVDNQMILAIADVYEVGNVADAFIAERVDIEMYVKTELTTGQYLAAVIEETGPELVFVENAEIQVSGRVDGDRAVLTIHDITGSEDGNSKVELGKTYSLGDADVYYGIVNGNSLQITVDGEQNSFTTAEINEIVRYYAGRGDVFDEIQVIQKHSLSNVIKKDFINSLRNILNWNAVEENPNLEVSIKFVFRNTADDLNDDLVWRLINPGIATKDINANVVLTTTEGNGVSVKLNKNTYNAQEVRVGFEGQKGSATIGKIESSIGTIASNAKKVEWVETDVPEEFRDYFETYIRLAALKKSTELQNNVQCIFMDYSDDTYEFTIGSAQNLASDTVYLFDQYTDELGELNVGLYYPLSTDGTWKLLSSVTATMATKDGVSTLTPLNDGAVYVLKSYTGTDGKAKTEVHYGTVVTKLIDLILNQTEVELEAYNDMEMSETAELTVKAFPSMVSLDEECIEWSVSYSEYPVIDLTPNGSKALIKAYSPGRVTVTVSYDEDNDGNADFTKECDVIVKAALEPEIPENVYALTNFDTKLSDIELPEGWTWKAPNTSITSYKELTSHRFTAVYKETLTAEELANGMVPRTVERDIEVLMLKIEGIDIVPVEYYEDLGGIDISDEPIPTVLEDEQSMMIDYLFILSCGGNVLANGDPLRMKVRSDYFGMDNPLTEDVDETNPPQLKLKWTLPKNTSADIEGDTLTFTADSSNAGKKTFTASVLNTKNKVIFKDSITVTVLKKTIANTEFIKEHSEYEAGVLIVRQPLDNYYTLKFAATDTKVIKKMTVISSKERYYNVIGESVWETRVQCTEGTPGFTNITVTTSDELKTKVTLGVKVIDETPKLLETAFELNKAYEEYYVPVTIQFPDDAMPTWDPYIGVEEQYSDIFDIQYDSDSNIQWMISEDGEEYVRRVDARLVFKDKDAAKVKTYKNVILEVDTANDIKELKINIKVTNKAPKVTIKQTKNINAFYKDMYGAEEDLRSGLLTVTAPGLNIGYVDVYSEGFYTDEIEPGVYKLCTESDYVTKGTYKNVYVGYEVRNEFSRYCGEAKLTVKVDEKAPALVLSQKSDTLYPNYGAFYSSVEVLNKATGEPIELSEAVFVENRKKGLLTPIYSEDTEITLAKNTFAVSASIEESGKLYFALQDGSWKNATAKFAFDVKEESWNKPVSVSYSVKVNIAKPTLKLGNSKLTLNMNAEVANYQMATATLKLNGFNGTNVIDGCDIQFVGTDAKSTAILNNVLTLDYNDSLGAIVAALHPNAGTLTKGTYEFKVNVTNEEFGYAASTTLTISIVDTAVAKCVKLSKKGSIDVLRRDTTYITYTPKFTNLAGKLNGVYLTGIDADKFDARLSSDGSKIEVYAHYDELSTKASYSIIPVITLETDNGEYLDTYEVTLPAQTIKVTQGKPKVTFTAPDGNVLYTQHGGELELDLNAVLGGENIVIENISLLNYTDDFEIDFWSNEFNSTTIYLRTSGDGFSQINKTGKSWTLKFAVTYANKAANEKPVTVSYKVTVK